MGKVVKFDFKQRFGKKKLLEFAEHMKEISDSIGFKVSARGWCYLMEQAGFINKDQFNKVEDAVNRCRKNGILPVDFVAEETARAFEGIEKPSTQSMESLLGSMLQDVLYGHKYFTPEWWDGEEYYIQVVVEKIDLKTLFAPVCKEYKIPIANSKGWSSILQRAEYCKRFKQAEAMGLKCVLLYCGDHDPDGVRISDTLRKNLEQVDKVIWSDGEVGYDPQNLIIERFGLNYDFIKENEITWIDNLITGSGKNLASPTHKNFKLPYVQKYLKEIGERKCEANACVTIPDISRNLMRGVIEHYLGEDVLHRFEKKRAVIRAEYENLLDAYGIKDKIEDIIEDFEE